jgi:hypothetical protein
MTRTFGVDGTLTWLKGDQYFLSASATFSGSVLLQRFLATFSWRRRQKDSQSTADGYRCISRETSTLAYGVGLVDLLDQGQVACNNAGPRPITGMAGWNLTALWLRSLSPEFCELFQLDDIGTGALDDGAGNDAEADLVSVPGVRALGSRLECGADRGQLL